MPPDIFLCDLSSVKVIASVASLAPNCVVFCERKTPSNQDRGEQHNHERTNEFQSHNQQKMLKETDGIAIKWTTARMLLLYEREQ